MKVIHAARLLRTLLLAALVSISLSSFVTASRKAAIAFASSETTFVPANIGWVRTDITLGAGDLLTIGARGFWSPGAPGGLVGPDGSTMRWPDNFLNLRDIGVCAFCATTQTPHWAALIGYIGTTPPAPGSYTSQDVLLKYSQALNIFLIGQGVTMGISNDETGPLWLTINDDAYSGIIYDNTGQLTVQIQVSQDGAVPYGGVPSPAQKSAAYNEALKIDQDEITGLILKGLDSGRHISCFSKLTFQAISQCELLTALGDLVDPLDLLRADWDLKVYADPPDPNYTVLVQPTIPTAGTVQPDAYISPEETDTIDALANCSAQALGIEQAMLTSLERAQGAAAVGSAYWIAQQTEAANTFAAELSGLVAQEAYLRGNLQQTIQDEGVLDLQVTASNVIAFLASVAQNGLPPTLTQAFGQAGADAATISQIAQSIAAVNPSSVPSSLFASLTDSGLASASLALGQLLASVPPVGPATIAGATLGVSGTIYNFGTWVNQSVEVTLSATVGTSGSGVAHIYYAVDNSACTPSALGNCTIYTGSPFAVSTAGRHTLTYFSVDDAGNTESAHVAMVNIDQTLPNCALTGTGINSSGQKYIQITVQDANSGLGSVVVTESNNATTPIPAFTAGTTGPLNVTATKINQSQSALVALQITDVAGNVTTCDPVLTELIRSASQPTTTTATSIAQSEHLLHIYNGDPGLSHLTINVNGKKVHERDLIANQQYTVDIAAWLQPGTNNTITIIARGKQRGDAIVVIADS